MMKKIFSLFLVFSLLYGCKQEILIPELESGENGLSTIFSFGVLAPTDAHLNGGWLFNIGYDENLNLTLDDEEITASAPLWHGNDGLNGTNGKDGLNGANGIDGTNGKDGLNGTDGKDGVDGQTPNLYLVTVDLPATEGHSNGGVLVTTVWDKNENDLIEESEIVGMYTVWHGNNGSNGSDGNDGSDGSDGQDGVDGKSPFIGEDGDWYYWSSETFTWINGGKSKGADGQDGSDGSNGSDGNDGSNGIDGKSPYILNGFWYFWNGTVWVNGGKSTGNDGADGVKGDKGDKGERGTVVGYTVSTAQNCTTNGYRVTITIDENLPTEYVQWFEVCDGKVGATGAQGAQGVKGADGKNGLNSLIKVIRIGNCTKIFAGLDKNSNNHLDVWEITSWSYVCDGLSSLISVSKKDEYGCVTIKSGLDTDKNNVLDASEVTSTQTICDGVDGNAGTNGLTSLITLTEDGDCVIIKSGLDIDKDNELDETEVTSTETVCDGIDGRKGDSGTNGLTSLITLTEDGDCVIIKSGLDIDKDNELDETEVTSTQTVCGCDLDDCEDDDCDDKETKVDVCHKEYDLKKGEWSYKTLNVALSALPAHIVHGDGLGACVPQ